MKIAVISIGVFSGCMIGYWVIPLVPEWSVPWIVVTALFFACFLISILKNQALSGVVAIGLLLSVGLLLIECLSTVALSSAATLIWVFCLFREGGNSTIVEAES